MNLDHFRNARIMITNPVVRYGLGAVAIASGVVFALKILGVVLFVLGIAVKLGLLIGLVAGGVYFYRKLKQ